MLRLVVGAKALHLGNPLFQRIPQTQVFDDQLLTQTKEYPASVQEITVLLADMEGFRGVPERLGVNAVPFMTEYFDLMSHHPCPRWHDHEVRCGCSSCFLEYARARG